MSAPVQIKLRDTEVRRLLDRLGADAFDELAEIAGATMESQTRRRLQDTKRSPDGDPWAPWSEGYARGRKGRGDLLDRTGALIDAVYSRPTGSGVEVGSAVIYASAHQDGSPSQGIPARPFLGLGAEDERELVQIFEDYLGRLARV